MKENKEFLEELCKAPSPSGYEKEVTDVWDRWCGKLGKVKHEFTDKNFNSVWSIGSGPKKILLSAHSDEISARVSYVSDKGLISIINVGGMDRKVVYGGKVLILRDTGGWLSGIVCHKPVHLQDDEEYDKSDPFKDLKIDIGVEERSGVENLGIYPGCPVVNRRDINLDFGDTKLYGNALDDKSCIYINYEVLRRLSEALESKTSESKRWSKEYTIYVGICGCEETGTENAKILAQRINPDISIDSDVTFDSEHDKTEPEEDGEAKMGEGCVIMSGPDKSIRLVNLLRETGKAKEIQFQLQASRAGGTNTRSFKDYSLDCETALLSIPLANMHQIYELGDWRDIDSAINLLYETVISGKL